MCEGLNKVKGSEDDLIAQPPDIACPFHFLFSIFKIILKRQDLSKYALICACKLM
jgi:hypothetical protein